MRDMIRRINQRLPVEHQVDKPTGQLILPCSDRHSGSISKPCTVWGSSATSLIVSSLVADVRMRKGYNVTMHDDEEKQRAREYVSSGASHETDRCVVHVCDVRSFLNTIRTAVCRLESLFPGLAIPCFDSAPDLLDSQLMMPSSPFAALSLSAHEMWSDVNNPESYSSNQSHESQNSSELQDRHLSLFELQCLDSVLQYVNLSYDQLSTSVSGAIDYSPSAPLSAAS